MFQFQIEEIAKSIVNGLNIEDRDPESYIRSVLNDYWKDKIAFTWYIEDVQSVATDIFGVDLSEGEAREILDDIFDCYDPEFGCNWDTINMFIDDFLTNRKEG